jgi:hypothetical protein
LLTHATDSCESEPTSLAGPQHVLIDGIPDLLEDLADSNPILRTRNEIDVLEGRPADFAEKCASRCAEVDANATQRAKLNASFASEPD